MDAKASFLKLRLDEVRRLKSEGRLDEAARLLEETWESAPGHPHLVLSFAGLYLRKKEPEKAVELLKAHREKLFGDRIYHNLLAQALRGVGSPKEALEEVRLVQGTDPDQASLTAQILFDLSEYEEAYALLKRALSIHSEHRGLLRLLARSAEKMGRPDEALDLIERLLRIEPTDKFAYKEKIRLKMAGLGAQGADELDRLLKLKRGRENIHLLSLKAKKLYDEKAYEDAARVFAEVLDRAPQNRYNRCMLGYSLRKSGKPREAVAHLSISFLENPRDRFVRASLEKSCKEIGDLPRLADLARQALAAHPDLRFLWGWVKMGEKENE